MSLSLWKLDAYGTLHKCICHFKSLFICLSMYIHIYICAEITYFSLKPEVNYHHHIIMWMVKISLIQICHEFQTFNYWDIKYTIYSKEKSVWGMCVYSTLLHFAQSINLFHFIFLVPVCSLMGIKYPYPKVTRWLMNNFDFYQIWIWIVSSTLPILST